MGKKFNHKSNKNNPFKYGGYSMAQSHKDKAAYKNRQIELKRQAMDVVNVLMNSQITTDKSPNLIQMNEKIDGLYCISVGKKFPYDFCGYPFDFNKMEMLANPTFIISMGDIQPIELKQFDHNQPIEFRVFRGTGNFEHYSFVLCKFNNLVQEFAFNPHLCKDALLEYMKNDANVFTVVVLEGTTKVVKILRALGFDDETKANLYSLWNYMLAKDIPQSEYENWYHGCWKYTTEQLWELAEPIGKWVSLY